jgi:hypothetical protein
MQHCARRTFLRLTTGVAAGAGIAPPAADAAARGALSADAGDGPTPGKYGKCSRCSCPGFFGSGYTCGRGGCGHHYDLHW